MSAESIPETVVSDRTLTKTGSRMTTITAATATEQSDHDGDGDDEKAEGLGHVARPPCACGNAAGQPQVTGRLRSGSISSPAPNPGTMAGRTPRWAWCLSASTRHAGAA